MRKAPQEAAIGFKQNTQKWVVVVGLLQVYYGRLSIIGITVDYRFADYGRLSIRRDYGSLPNIR